MTFGELLRKYIGTECHIQYLPDNSIFVRIHMGYGRDVLVDVGEDYLLLEDKSGTEDSYYTFPFESVSVCFPEKPY